MNIFIFSNDSNDFFHFCRCRRFLEHRNTTDMLVSWCVTQWQGKLPGTMSEALVFHLFSSFRKHLEDLQETLGKISRDREVGTKGSNCEINKEDFFQTLGTHRTVEEITNKIIMVYMITVIRKVSSTSYVYPEKGPAFCLDTPGSCFFFFFFTVK